MEPLYIRHIGTLETDLYIDSQWNLSISRHWLSIKDTLVPWKQTILNDQSLLLPKTSVR